MIIILFVVIKLGEVHEGPQTAGASSSSDESEIESDEEEREKR